MIKPKAKTHKPTKTGKALVDIRTIKQLQFWLQGIQEFQTDDWIPDKKQWHRIYDIIMSLSESQPNVGVIDNIVYSPSDIRHQPPIHSMDAYVQPTISLAEELNNLPPEASLPMSQLRAKMEHRAMIADPNANMAKPVNIDTSNANYESQFK